MLRKFEQLFGFKNEIKWSSTIVIISYHILGIYCVYYYALPVKWQTVLFAMIMYKASGLGITAGAHRLWTHKAFKATTAVEVFLLLCYASAGQNSLYDWVRDHRLHHKHSDTSADPHDATRGLFFSHIGWLMMKKNRHVLAKGRQIDMSDIQNDPLLKAFNRHFLALRLVFCFILPPLLCVALWAEEWRCAVTWLCFVRYLGMFHSELTVNSLAHAYGYKPFNKDIFASENRFVALATFGEGWHNYHHAFPFDYKAADSFDLFNTTTHWIRLWKMFGCAYDLKEATPEMIESAAGRLGDGSYKSCVTGKTGNVGAE